MARNVSLLSLPLGRGRGRRRADGGVLPLDSPVAGDEVALVHGWLCRCLPARMAEDLTVEVLGRAAAPGPDCVAGAPRGMRLQYLAVQSVLRARGVV